jgi:hypothetical protein
MVSKPHWLCISLPQRAHLMRASVDSHVIDILKLRTWVDCVTTTWNKHIINAIYPCYGCSSCTPCDRHLEKNGRGLIVWCRHRISISFAQFTHAMQVAAESHVVDFLKFRTWVDCVTSTWDIYIISAIYPCYGSTSCISCGSYLKVADIGWCCQNHIDYVYHYHIISMWWQ